MRGCEWIISVLMIAVVAFPAFVGAQSALPTARLEPAKIHKGDTFTYLIESNSSFAVDGFPKTANSNVKIFPQSFRNSQHVSDSSGNVSMSVTYRWQIQALEEGPFTIQPPKVLQNGQPVQIQPINSVINPIEQTEIAHFKGAGIVSGGDARVRRQYKDKFFSTVEAENKKPYLYEPVRLVTYLYREETNERQSINVKVESPASGRQVLLAQGSDHLMNQGAGFQSESVEINGRRFLRSPIQSAIVIPTRTGEIEAGGAELQLSIGTSDFMFFAAPSVFNVLSPTTVINVQPLPERPDDVVTQLTGDFTIGASIDRPQLQEGDLVTLNLKISGKGFLETVSLDNMPEIAGLALVSEEIEHNNNQGGRGSENDLVSSKLFKRVYQATQPGKITIPPLRFAIFLPELEIQEVRDTPPIDLDVIAAQRSSISVSAASPPEADRGKARVLETGGIMYIDTSPISGGKTTMASQSYALRPHFWIGHAIPLCLLLGWCGLNARKRRLEGDVAAVRSRTSRQRSHAALKEARQKKSDAPTAEFYSAISAGVLNHIAAISNRPAAGLTADDAVAELSKRDASDEVITELRRLLDVCDEMRYAPAADDNQREEDLSAAQNLITQINRLK